MQIFFNSLNLESLYTKYIKLKKIEFKLLSSPESSKHYLIKKTRKNENICINIEIAFTHFSIFIINVYEGFKYSIKPSVA